jgi:hypothetical protein
MNILEQAQKYLAAIPPAISKAGGHNQTLIAARAMVHGFNLPRADAERLLAAWNLTCVPPWSEVELAHKLDEADRVPFEKPRGYLLSQRSNPMPRRPQLPPAPGEPEEKAKYDLKGATREDIPRGIAAGFEWILRNAFEDGEGVRLMSALGEDGQRTFGASGGLILSREEWLEKLEAKGAQKLLNQVTRGDQGLFIGMNPLRIDGRGCDSDVTSLRRVLLEFDEISLEEQWKLLSDSNVPCEAVIYSGGKSIHAWIRVDAKDRQEYDRATALIYGHFKFYKPDPHNKNPARLSRCPDAQRGEATQFLVATGIGAPDFRTWSLDLVVEGIGETYSFDEICQYNPAEDGLTVAGNLWLRKGGSCLLVGPSGVGKSTLAMQFAYCWSIGRSAVGISPTKPLKILVVQAENDLADLSDFNAGILRGLGVENDAHAHALLRKHLIINHNIADTGADFITSLRKLVDRHVPDLILLDPLLSFIGADISKQEICSQFLRNWLNPILSASSVAVMAVHHSGKPLKDKSGKRFDAKFLSEWAYHGIGSSELTNWARAIAVLNQTGPGAFELLLAKRGKRAGALNPNGTPTTVLKLSHHPEFVFWCQHDHEDEPVSDGSEHKRKVKEAKVCLTKPQELATSNLHEFLTACLDEGEGLRPCIRRLNNFAGNSLKMDISEGSTRTAIELLVENSKLRKQDGLYFKGPNA